MGVSRPVVREAIIVLETIGLVTTRVGSGTYIEQQPRGVVLPSLEGSPLEIIEALSALECTAVANAAQIVNEHEIATATTDIELLEANSADFKTGIEHWPKSTAVLQMGAIMRRLRP